MNIMLNASVIEELMPLMAYVVVCGLGLSAIVSALSWMVLLFSKLMHKII